ncbi:MAG: hypothetical protein IPG96_02310 [Proteobacteria bacterium]|nr:hypothetical protein [Pseudomonadota bacterium]
MVGTAHGRTGEQPAGDRRHRAGPGVTAEQAERAALHAGVDGTDVEGQVVERPRFRRTCVEID